MRNFVMTLVLVFSLGCMGAVNGLTGMDMDMQFGADSVHPTDFPVQPIAGEPQMSMGMSADADGVNLPEGVEIDMTQFDKVRMDLITYETTDYEAASTKALGELQAAGFTLLPNNGEDVEVYGKDGAMFVIAGDAVEKQLTLIRLTPRASEPGPDSPKE